jgi:hypothetical protein
MMYSPGKTPDVISGHKSIAPSSAASKITEMTSALRRRLRARSRDSASFSSMHCDKLPRSLTDTPLPSDGHTRERHPDAAREWDELTSFSRDEGSGRAASDGAAEFAISVEIDTGSKELCPERALRSRWRGDNSKRGSAYDRKLLYTNCLKFLCGEVHHFEPEVRLNVCHR